MIGVSTRRCYVAWCGEASLSRARDKFRLDSAGQFFTAARCVSATDYLRPSPQSVWLVLCLWHPCGTMLDLGAGLDDAMPGLSHQARTVLAALVACGGRTGSVERFAHSAGLTSRYQLARLLRREGLPQVEELGAWIYTLVRLLDWETSRVSLCKSALCSGEDPGNGYRRVQHVCGLRWSEARAIGFDHVLVRFIQRCTRRDVALEQGPGQQSALGVA